MSGADGTARPHPDSLIRTPDGRTVFLKVHRCLWSGQHPENSLPAILECYRARVARAEIDLHMLQDADFLITHDPTLEQYTTGSGRVNETTRREAERLRLRWDGRISDERPPLLSELIAAIAAEPHPTLLELDAQDFAPWPWPRVEELARLVEPARDRVIFGSSADWNLRRLQRVDPSLPVGCNPMFYLDWTSPDDDEEPFPGARGVYGYFDVHPLARRRLSSTPAYLRDRLGGLLRLVPGSREVHLRLHAFEQMLADGFGEAVDLVHESGLLLDVWTLNADTPHWEERVLRAVTAGVDLVTTDTAPRLAAAYRESVDADRPASAG